MKRRMKQTPALLLSVILVLSMTVKASAAAADTGSTVPDGVPYYSYSIPQGGTQSGKVNVTAAGNGTLAYALEEGFDVANGAVTVDKATGAWTYTAPDEVFLTGIEGVSFYVVASDAAGGSFRTRIQIKVEPTPTNRTYYVDGNTGSDSNDGLSHIKALKTLQAAHDKTNPGDTVLIYDSTIPYGWYSDEAYRAAEAKGEDLYTTVREGVLQITRSGLPDSPITYKAAEGQKPVIKGNGVWKGIAVSANYIVVEGLTVYGEADRVTYDTAWHTFWGKMVPKDSPEYESSWKEIMGESNSNGIMVVPAKGYEVSAGGNDKVRSPKVSIPHHVTIRNCVAEYNGGTGIGGDQCDYVTFENCTAVNNGWWSMYGNSGFSFNSTVDVDDNFDEYKLIIRNCVAAGNRHFIPWKTGTTRLSDGNGIIIDCIDQAYNNFRGKTLIANNLVYENGGSGIHSFHGDNVYIINNTVANNGATPDLGWSELFSHASENVHMYNNLTYSRAGNVEDPVQFPTTLHTVTYDYNLFTHYPEGSTAGQQVDGATVGTHNLYNVDSGLKSLPTIVHMPEGFDVKMDYEANWYTVQTTTAAEPSEWSQADNASKAGWYPNVSYDVKIYGYDFTMSADSPAKGAASSQWQKVAGGEKYDNVIGIFSDVGANITAMPSQAPTGTFIDVASSAWYYDSVTYAVSNGLMSGIGGGRFDPNGTATTSQLIAALYSLEGKPAGYADAMAWASANKVIISTGAAQKLSREDVADILHRYAAYKGYSTAASGDLSRFPDAANVKSAQAMTWAVGTGIINGSNGKLLAQDNATRAQVATILMNFCNQVAK